MEPQLPNWCAFWVSGIGTSSNGWCIISAKKEHSSIPLHRWFMTYFVRPVPSFFSCFEKKKRFEAEAYIFQTIQFVALLAKWARSERLTSQPWTGSAAACPFLFSDLLFSAFEAVDPLSALSATQLAMWRSSLLSANCNSIFSSKIFSWKPSESIFPELFPSMFYSHCPLSNTLLHVQLAHKDTHMMQ